MGVEALYAVPRVNCRGKLITKLVQREYLHDLRRIRYGKRRLGIVLLKCRARVRSLCEITDGTHALGWTLPARITLI